jgi:hypothetical protein
LTKTQPIARENEATLDLMFFHLSSSQTVEC